ncbi:Hsp70 family protein, partial [Patescibacteria group bacterium]|nr:Hsp70 family protein [Patescibacteria group bacterium]
KEQIFSTAADNQPSVEIHVLQGEREMASDNKTLGRFMLSGLPPAPRGVPQVLVKFDIDANGILNVSAKDQATGKEQKITITASSGLSKDEIEKMRKDAELHADEDKKKREKIDVVNQAETVAYSTEKLIKDAGDKMAEEDKKQLQEKVEMLKKAKEADNVEEMKKVMEELNQIAQKIGAGMYENTQKHENTESTKAEQGEEEKKDNVVDAEAEDVEEDKK